MKRVMMKVRKETSDLKKSLQFYCETFYWIDKSRLSPILELRFQLCAGLRFSEVSA